MCKSEAVQIHICICICNNSSYFCDSSTEENNQVAAYSLINQPFKTPSSVSTHLDGGWFMNDVILQHDKRLEITVQSHQGFLLFKVLTISNWLKKTTALYIRAFIPPPSTASCRERFERRWEEKMEEGSKPCDCHRKETKTEMLHIQELFSCWNMLGAHQRRRVRSVHKLRHLPALK